MNFVRFKGKYVDLSTIDINENIDTYANFFSKAFGKTEEEIRKILTDYKANSFLAILEKNEENLLGLIGFEKQNLLNLRSNITLDLIDVHSDKEKLLQCGKESISLLTDYAYNTLNYKNILAEVPTCSTEELESFSGSYDYIGTRDFSYKTNNNLYDTAFFEMTPNKFNQSDLAHYVGESKILKIKYNLNLKNKMDIIKGDRVDLVIPSKTILYIENNPNWSYILANKTMFELGSSLNDMDDALCMGEAKEVVDLYSMAKSFDYYIVDKNGMPIGYVNRLNIDNNNLKTDIEINIFNKNYRGKGYGRDAYAMYIKELRRIGYVSIGDVVFDFNKSSLNMHDNMELNEYAIRSESYFAYGKYQDMHYYEVPIEYEETDRKTIIK